MKANKVKFTKMHGAGNDYIYVNTLLYNIPDPVATAIEWSKPHFGIGSDGLVLIGAPGTPDADYSMRIFNNDGSEAMMCGNASRCIGKYLHDKGICDKNPIRLATLSGVKILSLHTDADDKVDSVTVDMGAPILQNARQIASADGTMQEGALVVNNKTYKGTFVCMGNPHFVIFVDDIESIDLTTEGKALEFHEIFPERCNIEFAQVLSPDADGVQNIRMRVWERGSGITLACGTGACATAVAAALTGRSSRHSNIIMDGGTLNIEWSETDGHVYKTGPATIVFEGETEL